MTSLILFILFHMYPTNTNTPFEEGILRILNVPKVLLLHPYYLKSSIASANIWYIFFQNVTVPKCWLGIFITLLKYTSFNFGNDLSTCGQRSWFNLTQDLFCLTDHKINIKKSNIYLQEMGKGNRFIGKFYLIHILFLNLRLSKCQCYMWGDKM